MSEAEGIAKMIGKMVPLFTILKINTKFLRKIILIIQKDENENKFDIKLDQYNT